MNYASFLIPENNWATNYLEIERILQEYFIDSEFKFENEIIIEKQSFQQKTRDLKLVPYSKLNEFDVKDICTKVMIVGFMKPFFLQGFIYSKKVVRKDSDLQVDTAYKVSTNKRLCNNPKDSESKKPKFSSLSLNYSEKILKEIFEDYSISGKKATKIRNEDKIALYCQLDSGYLKIVHYFDASSENLKGMEIIKSIQHDNINKIYQFKKQSLTNSQLNELFFEEVPLSTNIEPSIFMTFSEYVGDLIDFIIFMNQKDLKTNLLGFSKLMLDFIEAVNVLHENKIIHCDISMRNCGILFRENIMTIHAKEKNSVLENLRRIPNFNLILIDFNHCKVEGQEEAKFNSNPNMGNVFFPFISIPYCPLTESVQFTKEHDYYSVALVLAQLFLATVCKVSISEILKWEKGNLKELIIVELNKKMSDFTNLNVVIQLLKETIENEGKSDLCNFQKTF